jgi:hypothetical protein
LASAVLGLSAYEATNGPTLVRALPQGQFILYADLTPLRGTGLLGPSLTARAPEYQQFIRESGVDWERDVDELALSISDSAAAAHHTTTLLLRGRFGTRLRPYLAAHGKPLGGVAGGNAYYFDREDDPPIKVLLMGDGFAAVTSDRRPAALAEIAQRYTWRNLRLASGGLIDELPRADRNRAVIFAALDYAGLAAESDASRPALFSSLRGTRVLTASLTQHGVALRLNIIDRTTNQTNADAAYDSVQELLASLRRSSAQPQNAPLGFHGAQTSTGANAQISTGTPARTSSGTQAQSSWAAQAQTSTGAQALSGDAATRALLSHLKVTESGNDIHITAEAPVADLLALLQTP